MQGVHLRKYGVQTTIDFELYEVDGVDLRVDWVPAAADCEVMKDEGASTQCTNTATDEGSTYSVVLTATELQAARLVLKIVDAATKVFLDKVIIIETYGQASAMHAFDLNTALPANLLLLFDGSEGFAPAYAGPRGPGVYLNDAAGNTNTASGVDGTWLNPVSTIAAAKTIADALSLDRIYLVGNSDITLAATMEDYEFIGIGELTSNIVNLGSQDVDRSAFYNLTIEGTQGGTGRIFASGCALQDPGAGATTLHIFASSCGIKDTIEVDTSADNVFDQCYSLVAGTAAPIIVATGVSGTISIRHYTGGIELSTLSASHNVSVETDGQVIFTADCNVNANVSMRGNLTITDNTAGMNSLVTGAVYDKRADIAAILTDSNEIQGKLPTNKFMGSSDGADDDTTLNTIATDAARLTAARAAVLTDWIDGGRLDLIIDAILGDSNELQTDWANGGRLDLLLDAIKVMTDWQRSVSGTVVVNNPGTDTIFDLTAVTGTLSTNNDSCVNMVITFLDVSGSVLETRKVEAFVGASGRATVDEALTFPVDDGVDTFILWNKYSPTAAAGGGATAQQVHEYDVSGIVTEGQAGYEIQQSGGGNSIYSS